MILALPWNDAVLSSCRLFLRVNAPCGDEASGGGGGCRCRGGGGGGDSGAGFLFPLS